MLGTAITHTSYFTFWNPQGVSSGEQSPVSSMAAEQIPHSSCAERGCALARGEPDKDLTDPAGLWAPPWHPQPASANFSHSFPFSFLAFWVTQPDFYGEKKKAKPHHHHHTYNSVIRKRGHRLWQVGTRRSQARNNTPVFFGPALSPAPVSQSGGQTDCIQMTGLLCQKFPPQL